MKWNKFFSILQLVFESERFALSIGSYVLTPSACQRLSRRLLRSMMKPSTVHTGLNTSRPHASHSSINTGDSHHSNAGSIQPLVVLVMTFVSCHPPGHLIPTGVKQSSSVAVHKRSSAAVQYCSSVAVQKSNSAAMQQCGSAAVQQCGSAAVRQCWTLCYSVMT